ncbi:MAG: hypothetical protein KIH62_002935 [Candidatus Kerfeldbacteria bacterium]|nr:hypothetical protein [Candidatus Kerfeldbacteria bacterium]
MNPLQRKEYTITSEKEKLLLDTLQKRTDTEAKRLLSYLALPDLTRTPHSPLYAVVQRLLSLPTLKDFDLITIPEIIPSSEVFDLFNFPKDHPARTSSDSYYVEGGYILRPHPSVMWKYYLDLPEVQQKLEENGRLGVMCYGKVYRRDEIDWQHSNVLHQIDGLYIVRKDIQNVVQQDLEAVLLEVAESLFGKNLKSRFSVDHFPYTDPSIEMVISWRDQWVEILGSGIPHPQVIKNLGLDPEVYTGWAFGFGADRLAMLKMQIPDIRLLRSTDERVTRQLTNIDNVYEPVSKYPPVVRDISFVVTDSELNINQYYEMIREVVGDEYVEEVKFLDEYRNAERWGEGRTSYTIRIVYRNLERTLTNEEVDALHSKLMTETEQRYKAAIRK